MQDTRYKIRVTSHEPRATNKGLTLTEMTITIAVVALLASLSVPAIRTFFKSLGSPAGTKSMISAALSSARAVAAKEQRYAGLRFQERYQQDNNGNQYMIFIVHDQQNTKLANGFRAVEGLKPIKLSDNIVVENELSTDNTKFSIVFSPSGKLVIHDLCVRNKHGETNDSSNDDIFNTQTKVENGIGMFVQDGGDEPSRNSFVIYYDKSQRDKSEVIYINPYTGTIISMD